MVAVLLPAVGRAGQLRLADPNGRRVDPFDVPAGTRAIVVLFTSTDCPIANRYAPEVKRLHDAFSPSGVVFWLVYPNPADTAEAVRGHLASFGYRMGALRDPGHELVRRTGARVTPEAVVFAGAGLSEAVYRGRIDNRYVRLGVERASATEHDLRDALAAVLAGRPVPRAVTQAVGCILTPVEEPGPITFTRHVAPILRDKCAMCHRPGGPAPFSLVTYEQVKPRAHLIAEVTRTRLMPPWKAGPESGEFLGQRHLTDADIATLQRWIDEGLVEGDARDLPDMPRWAEGWQLGTPDVVVGLPEPYTLAAEGTDVFRVFVLPVPLDRTRYVRGLEFRPGNPRVVHHANIRIDPTPASRRRDEADPAPGYDGLLAHSAVYPAGHFLGWTPGQVAPLVPDTMAWRIDRGTDLVVQLHLQPSGKPEVVAPTIGLFFGHHPPTTTPAVIRLGNQRIDIPAGEPDYVIADSYVLPVDVELHAVQPHAHYRARQVEGVATLPDGTRRSLIRIADWDFRWQHVYRYAEPLVLPKGTTLAMRFRYDNSAANPRNPQLPPRRVRWGQRSFDEMGDLWFQVVPRRPQDLTILTQDVRRKMAIEDAAGFETMIESSPDDTELHDEAALLYLELGRPDRAVAHFAQVVRAKPLSAAAHYNLGTALTVAGRLDEAMREYRRALEIDPRYANAHNNLGKVLETLGRLDEAIRHYQEALRADPTHAQARRNLTQLSRKR